MKTWAMWENSSTGETRLSTLPSEPIICSTIGTRLSFSISVRGFLHIRFFPGLGQVIPKFCQYFAHAASWIHLSFPAPSIPIPIPILISLMQQ